MAPKSPEISSVKSPKKSPKQAPASAEKVTSVVTNPRSKLLIANRIKSAVKSEDRGVVYVGRLPKEFFEPDLHKFFSQFGDITRLRLSRSKKNAHSKGYGYIEFELKEVAEIVAKEMNKYFIMSQQIVCEFMPKDKLPAGLFKHCNSHMKDMTKLRRVKAIADHNKGDGTSSVRQKRRREEAGRQTGSRLKASGIEYDLDGVDEEGTEPAAKKRKVAQSPPRSPAKAPKSSPKVLPQSPKVTLPKSPKTAPKTSKSIAKTPKTGKSVATPKTKAKASTAKKAKR